MNTFADALSFVLDHEGRVNENVPGDPGGATHWGITAADYALYRKEHGLAPAPVFGMTPSEVEAVYTEHYWQPLQCDHLPYPLALALFDTGVNCGVGRAAVWLQKVLGVTPDGAIGPNTMAAARAYIAAHGVLALAEGLLARRDAYYMTIGGQPSQPLHKFLPGWLSRTQDLRTAADRAQSFAQGAALK